MTDYLDKLEFSKNEVRKATEKLVENKLNLEDKLNCLYILANFRSAHNYPTQSMIVYFRKKAFETDKSAIVVRRLKRIPSIINKLKRLPTMQVTTMGDIGGVRIITKDIKQVMKIRDGIVRGRTRNKLLKENDYITAPKESGYRGIHLMYSYQGSKKDYKNFRIELQIRSQIQHAWSTAVEVVGTFLGENLKASDGSRQWLDFFKVVSKAFTCIENNQKINHSLKEKLKLEANSLKVFDTLRSFGIAAKHSDKKEGFYLLQLDIKEKTISTRFFHSSFIDYAYEEYRRIEQEISEDTTKDVVLVSAKSLKELKKAYPNYFADTALFLEHLNNTIK